MINRIALGFLFLQALAGCAHSTAPRETPAAELPAAANPPARAHQSETPGQVTVAVVGINDFHGSLLPRENKLPDGRIVRSGGAAVLHSMIRHLNEEMNGRVLVIDAGDEWQGTLESNPSQGATVVEFFNRLGVKVAAIGNHEFDFGMDALHGRAAEAKYPYVASNIHEKKTRRRVRWKNVAPSALVEVEGIRFGVIGVTTRQTPGATRYETVKHLDFVDPIPEVTSESKRLQAAGAHAVLVTAHAGTECRTTPGLKDWKIHPYEQNSPGCDPNQEIALLAAKTGPAVLHGIVAGHTHQVIHHYLNGIAVVEGEAYNQYFNVIYYTFDKATKRLLPDLTRIEGVIPICEHHFKGTSHCEVKRLPAGAPAPALVPAEFHGKAITPDPATAEWLRPIREGTDRFRKQIVGQATEPLVHHRDRESAFGNLVADALRDAGKADFALVNSGGIRTSLDAGPITYDGIFRALPFDNFLHVVELSGKEVKLLYRIATSGAHGAIGLSGLQIELRPFQEEAKKTDLDRNGKLETWETDRLLSIRTEDGKPISDHRRYRVATFDYLTGGGDDLAWFMGRIPSTRIRGADARVSRDLVLDYLKKTGPVPAPGRPLLDSKAPRIRFRSN